MFENILVPTDFSAKSAKSLDMALKLCDPKANVSLIHVIETIQGAEEVEFEAFYEKLKTRAEEKMGKMAARGLERNKGIKSVILFGNRVREIVGYALKHNTDLIVLSSHRIDKGDASQGWATISYRISILAHCTVLLVK